MTPESDAIISIHPRHANAILDGTKTVELRRRIPALSVGTRLWIYATRPVGAVIGIATVDSIVRGDPEEIWLKFGDRTAIDRVDYDAYFGGAHEAIGLLLINPQRSAKSVEIEKLRSLRMRFHPPQVMMSINSKEADHLSKMSSITI